MLKYNYTLTEEDYMSFCKYSIFYDKNALLLRLSLVLSIPGIFALALFLLKPVKQELYLFAIAGSIVWFFASQKIFSKLLDVLVRQTIKKKKDCHFSNIELRVEKNNFKINGTSVSVSTFLFVPKLLVLKCADETNAIIPLRIFKDSHEVTNFLNYIRS